MLLVVLFYHSRIFVRTPTWPGDRAQKAPSIVRLACTVIFRQVSGWSLLLLPDRRLKPPRARCLIKRRHRPEMMWAEPIFRRCWCPCVAWSSTMRVWHVNRLDARLSPSKARFRRPIGSLYRTKIGGVFPRYSPMLPDWSRLPCRLLSKYIRCLPTPDLFKRWFAEPNTQSRHPSDDAFPCCSIHWMMLVR